MSVRGSHISAGTLSPEWEEGKIRLAATRTSATLSWSEVWIDSVVKCVTDRHF